MAEGVRWLVDSYGEWIGQAGIPVARDFAVNAFEVETTEWPLIGGSTAIIELDAHDDFLTVQVIDIAAGGELAPRRLCYEELIYVLSGNGSTRVHRPDGSSHTFEWQSGSLFAIPFNALHQHFNGSGRSRTRLLSYSNLKFMMNLLRDEHLIFEAPNLEISRGFSSLKHFEGDGTLLLNREHRHMWETNFVPNLTAFGELQPSPSRGNASSSIMFVLADSSMHAHMSDFPAASYKKAHRHTVGYMITMLSGTGYSVYWYEGAEQDRRRVDWARGVLHSPPHRMFHQHFNTGATPARYLACAFGGLRYPILTQRRSDYEGDPTVRDETQIEYEDQEPWVDEMFQAGLKQAAMKV